MFVSAMLHTLKRSVPIPCGSNTQDFDTTLFSVRGSCLKPSHQPQMTKRTNFLSRPSSGTLHSCGAAPQIR